MDILATAVNHGHLTATTRQGRDCRHKISELGFVNSQAATNFYNHFFHRVRVPLVLLNFYAHKFRKNARYLNVFIILYP